MFWISREVVTAGNNDNVDDSIDCPGHASRAITVGAIDKHRKMAPYSSYGKPGSGKLNIVAPGNVYIDGVYRTGTSFAAPLVTGVLGAILHHAGTVSKATEYIYSTVEDLNLPRHQQGLGCISIEKIVEVISSETHDTERDGQSQGS